MVGHKKIRIPILKKFLEILSGILSKGSVRGSSNFLNLRAAMFYFCGKVASSTPSGLPWLHVKVLSSEKLVNTHFEFEIC